MKRIIKKPRININLPREQNVPIEISKSSQLMKGIFKMMNLDQFIEVAGEIVEKSLEDTEFKFRNEQKECDDWKKNGGTSENCPYRFGCLAFVILMDNLVKVGPLMSILIPDEEFKEVLADMVKEGIPVVIKKIKEEVPELEAEMAKNKEEVEKLEKLFKMDSESHEG